MAREKLFSTGALAAVTQGQLMDLVNAYAVKKTAQLQAAAEKDRRIAEFQTKETERYNELYGELESWLETEKARLTQIIQAHSDWFPKGHRSVVADNAEYGYRKDRAGVEIDKTRLADLKEFADENGYVTIYQETIKPVAAAISKLVKSGVAVPGVTEKGFSESAFVDVKTPTLDEKMKGK